MLRVLRSSPHFEKRLLALSYLSLSACLTFCPRGTTWLPLNGFILNFVFEYIRRRVERIQIQISLKSGKNNGHFIRRHMYTCDSISLNSSYMRNISDKVAEKIKTHILYSINHPLPPRKWCPLEDNVGKCCRSRQATYDNMEHVHFMMDTSGYRRKLLVKVDNCCFSTATMVAGTRLIIMLHESTLSVCLLFSWASIVQHRGDKYLDPLTGNWKRWRATS